eukprot:5899445-Pleurochrysis_carterae.AAC.6
MLREKTFPGVANANARIIALHHLPSAPGATARRTPVACKSREALSSTSARFAGAKAMTTAVTATGGLAHRAVKHAHASAARCRVRKPSDKVVEDAGQSWAQTTLTREHEAPREGENI